MDINNFFTYRRNSGVLFQKISSLLFQVNHSVNLLLYTVCGARFRDELCGMFCIRFRRKVRVPFDSVERCKKHSLTTTGNTLM